MNDFEKKFNVNGKQNLGNESNNYTWQNQNNNIDLTDNTPYNKPAENFNNNVQNQRINNYNNNNNVSNDDEFFVLDVPDLNQCDYNEPENINIQEKTKQKKSKKGLWITVISICCVGAISLSVGLGFAGSKIIKNYLDNNGSNNSGESGLSIQSKPNSKEETLAEGKLTTVQIAEKVTPSVVGIVIYQKGFNFQELGQGSGIIMSEDGYILTNSHVVGDGAADGIKVVLSDGKEFEAKLIGADAKTDIAVIKVEAQNLPNATFGNSDDIKVGERVVAIGNPTGLQLAGSVTEGIISGVNRNISGNGSAYSLPTIQTDAAINPGNSGGALVNEYGQVIGINSAKLASAEIEGLGFAIPTTLAKPIIDDLMTNGYVANRVKIGITFQVIDDVLARINNIPKGLYVVSVDPSVDAAKKGIEKGDIIAEINGEKIEKAEQVTEILKNKKPGDSITLKVLKRDVSGNINSKNIEVTLEQDRGVVDSNTPNN